MISAADSSELAQAVDRFHAAPTLERTAQLIVEYARTRLEADQAGISVIRARGRLETLAPTAPVVTRADTLQHELDEGPCQDATAVQACPDLSAHERWPRWSAKVRDLGIRSALIAELRDTAERRLGTVNLYWGHARTITAEEIAFINTLARHAELALGQSLRVASLRSALASRTLIGQAQGILMERYGLDSVRAFKVLKRYSQDHNVKLRHVAGLLVSNGELPHFDGRQAVRLAAEGPTTEDPTPPQAAATPA